MQNSLCKRADQPSQQRTRLAMTKTKNIESDALDQRGLGVATCVSNVYDEGYPAIVEHGLFRVLGWVWGMHFGMDENVHGRLRQLS